MGFRELFQFSYICGDLICVRVYDQFWKQWFRENIFMEWALNPIKNG